MLYGIIFKKWWIVLIIAILFEIIENTEYVAKRFRKIGYTTSTDSIVNMVGDVICNMFGYSIEYFVPGNYKWLLLLAFIINEIIFLSNKNLRQYSILYMIYIFIFK